MQRISHLRFGRIVRANLMQEQLHGGGEHLLAADSGVSGQPKRCVRLPRRGSLFGTLRGSDLELHVRSVVVEAFDEHFKQLVRVVDPEHSKRCVRRVV